MNQPSGTTRNVRRGFTFTEVMFAVIILGVGFVMIAAILPVAIQQSKLSVDEATAAAVTQAALNTITTSAPSIVTGGTGKYHASPYTLFPPTRPAANGVGKGTVFYFGQTSVGSTGEPDNTGRAKHDANNDFLTVDQQINLMMGSMIYNTDPRFGWVAFYQRDSIDATGTGSPFARLTILVMQSKLKANYSAAFDTTNAVTPDPSVGDFPVIAPVPPAPATPKRVDSGHPLVGTFRPQVVWVFLTERLDKPDILTFVNSGTNPTGIAYEPRAGEGAFIIIADDKVGAGTLPTSPPYVRQPGDLNSHVYRLGAPSTDFPGSYELESGYDMNYYKVQGSTTLNSAPYNENIPYADESLPANQIPPYYPSGRSVGTGKPAMAYIVGRGLPLGAAAEDDDSTSWRPGNGTNIPTGAVQDVSVYQCNIPIPQ